MANVTITLDDNLLKRAKRVALERDISLTELIRLRLREEVEKEEGARDLAALELTSLWGQGLAVGPRTWSRDDLHDR